jgi:hypothetical protein
MGKTVVFEIGALRMLIAELAAMTVDPELFSSHRRRALVLQNCGRQIAQRLSRGLRTHRHAHHPCGYAGREHGPPPTSHASRGEAAEGERFSVAHQFRRLLGGQHGVA